LITNVAVAIPFHLQVMKLQVNIQNTPIVDRIATDVALVLGRLIPVAGIVLF